MFEPACPQVAPPVLLDPPADGRFPEVAAGLLALDPLEALGPDLAVGVHAQALVRQRVQQARTVGAGSDWALSIKAGTTHSGQRWHSRAIASAATSRNDGSSWPRRSLVKRDTPGDRSGAGTMARAGGGRAYEV